MVDPDDFKARVLSLLPQDYAIEFLGADFSGIVQRLTDKQTESIYGWLAQVVRREFQPILVASKRTYKAWPINQLLIFRHPFTLGLTQYRILLVKVKNSVYIEFHLGDHKYYDRVRKGLDLSRRSA